jgi:hypothetical protein
LPIFSGCENITRYFDDDSIVRLGPLRDLDGAVRTIRDILVRDPWLNHLSAIKKARTRLLEDYNLFSLLEHVTKNNPDAQTPQLVLEETLRVAPQPNGGVVRLARKAANSIKKRVMIAVGKSTIR